MDQTIKRDKGKPRLTLVPLQIMYDIAAVREYGVDKYGDPDNWRKVEIQRYRDALFRHFLEYIKDPYGVDSESSLPHRWHLECNMAFLAELEKNDVHNNFAVTMSDDNGIPSHNCCDDIGTGIERGRRMEEKVEKIKTAILAVIAIIGAILVAVVMTMVVKADYVNAFSGLRVRTAPSLEADVVEILPYGTEVLGKEVNGWIQLKGGSGYVSAEYVRADDPNEEMEYLGEWRITAYAYTGNPCANGNYPVDGYTVACNSLPFGTKIYIDGVGVRTVEDNDGGAMGNEWCDLYLESVSKCVTWGDQYRKVWRIE